MDNLLVLCASCKNSITLTVNDHRDYYQSVQDYMDENASTSSDEFANHLVEPDILRKMIELDTVVHLQFYPNGAITFYRIYHYDVAQALAKAVAILVQNKIS